MTLKKLIDDQIIRLDNHNAGRIVNSGINGIKDVHFDKRFIGASRRGMRVKIYLDGRLKFNNKFNERDKQKVISEIQHALKKNIEKLRTLAHDVADALERWSSSEILLDEAQGYAARIAKAFNLRPGLEKEFVVRVKDRLKRYVSIHRDEMDKSYWIDQNKNRISVGPGKKYIGQA